MGEAKRRREIVRAVVDELTQRFVDEGKIIAVGYTAYVLQEAPSNLSDVAQADLRKAYYAGAQHLWASIFSVLEPGVEPTERDLKRMSEIADELDAFYSAATGAGVVDNSGSA